MRIAKYNRRGDVVSTVTARCSYHYFLTSPIIRLEHTARRNNDNQQYNALTDNTSMHDTTANAYHDKNLTLILTEPSRP